MNELQIKFNRIIRGKRTDYFNEGLRMWLVTLASVYKPRKNMKDGFLLYYTVGGDPRAQWKDQK